MTELEELINEWQSKNYSKLTNPTEDRTRLAEQISYLKALA